MKAIVDILKADGIMTLVKKCAYHLFIKVVEEIKTDLKMLTYVCDSVLVLKVGYFYVPQSTIYFVNKKEL